MFLRSFVLVVNTFDLRNLSRDEDAVVFWETIVTVVDVAVFLDSTMNGN